MRRLFAIGKITKVSGLKGEVRCKPLSRYFEEYIDEKPLFLGFSESFNTAIELKTIIPSGKRPRYRFCGVNTQKSAQSFGTKVHLEELDKRFVNHHIHSIKKLYDQSL